MMAAAGRGSGGNVAASAIAGPALGQITGSRARTCASPQSTRAVPALRGRDAEWLTRPHPDPAEQRHEGRHQQRASDERVDDDPHCHRDGDLAELLQRDNGQQRKAGGERDASHRDGTRCLRARDSDGIAKGPRRASSQIRPTTKTL